MVKLSIILALAMSPVFTVGVQAQESAAGLPDGPAKGMVEGVCTGCHQTSEILRSSGYTRAGWTELTSTMVDLSASPAEREQIIEYLATHFPPNDDASSQAVPGDVQITFKEWQVPTLGQRSRDPVEGPDGSIWWAGQWGNLIGRINPATGEMKEYPLPPNAMPHTVVLDGAGNVWYTGNKNGTVGKLDPEDGRSDRLQDAGPGCEGPAYGGVRPAAAPSGSPCRSATWWAV